jgi:hypothetical protein
MSASTEGICVVILKTEEALSDAPFGKDQPQVVALMEVELDGVVQTYCMYGLMSMRELQTASVEKSGQVQLPVGQMKVTDGFGSAENMPL